MKNLNESLLESIELIEESALTSEIDVLINIGNEYSKIGMLMEYADESVIDEFQIIQEAAGTIDYEFPKLEDKSAKKDDKKDESSTKDAKAEGNKPAKKDDNKKEDKKNDSEDKGFIAKCKKICDWFYKTWMKITDFIADSIQKLIKATIKGFHKITNHTVKGADGTEFKSNDLYKVAEDMNKKYREVWHEYLKRANIEVTEEDKKREELYGDDYFKFDMKDASLMVRVWVMDEKTINKMNAFKSKIKDKSSYKEVNRELTKLTKISPVDMIKSKWLKSTDNAETQLVPFDKEENRKAMNELVQSLEKNTTLTNEEKGKIVNSFYTDFTSIMSYIWQTIKYHYESLKKFVTEYFNKFGYSAADAKKK